MGLIGVSNKPPSRQPKVTPQLALFLFSSDTLLTIIAPATDARPAAPATSAVDLSAGSRFDLARET